MSNYKAAEVTHLGIGLSPASDRFAGTVTSDVINMENYGKCRFVLIGDTNATGTSTITVEACDDTVPTTTAAVPFHYAEHSSNDVRGTLTAATTAGFTCAARANRLITVEVDAEDLIASGYSYVRLKAAEVVDSAVLGTILFELFEPKATGSVDATVLT
jgi:RNA:NAD 2'-phosphotransferase (TPT1/KptA family)